MTQEYNFNIIDKKEFVDIPSSEPKYKISLPKVGITKRPRYFNVIDPFTNKSVRLFSKIDVNLSLPRDQRGLHMSRIEKEFIQVDKLDHMKIEELSKTLCENIRQTQKQDHCTINFDFFYENVVTKNVSKFISNELIKLHYSYSCLKDTTSSKIGITAPILNACPCTQRWGIRDFYKSLGNEGFDQNQIKKIIQIAPLQAHTNKGQVFIGIESDKINFKDIYNIINDSSPILRELLSDQDEHIFVKETHQLGLFCEDVTRNIIKNLINKFSKQLDNDSLVEIIVTINESIHFHNLYASIKDTISNLKFQGNKGDHLEVSG